MNLSRHHFYSLVLFHIFIIALSNYLVTVKFDFFDLKLTFAAFTFPLIVVATDLTVRLASAELARKIVAIAFIPAILISIFIVYMSGTGLPFALRIGVASGCAYLMSNILDVFLFQTIRERMQLWFWAPAISAIFANILDTFTFFIVAFYNSDNPYMAAFWFQIACGQAGIKVLISLFVILPAYGACLACINRKIHKILLQKIISN